jgi:hypothetical protein
VGALSRPLAISVLHHGLITLALAAGSGVFNSSSVIYSNTRSIGISIMIWLVGVSMALLGVMFYIELGLTVPTYRLGGSKEKTAVVRSGGELPYVGHLNREITFETDTDEASTVEVRAPWLLLQLRPIHMHACYIVCRGNGASGSTTCSAR